MRRATWLLLGMLATLGLGACGSSNDMPPPDAANTDSRTEEAKEADDNMAKHFKKFGNR